MNQIVQLDPRVVPYEKKLKMAGAAVVAVAASGVVIVGSLSVIAAVGVGLVALAAVNLGLPLGARYIALMKQKGLTTLAETFSEETIRSDEREEGDRLATQQSAYRTQSAEYGAIIEELQTQMVGASEDQQQMLQGEVDELNRLLAQAEEAVQRKIDDFAELKKVNGIYISMNRAAKAKQRGQDQQRSAEQIQAVQTARNAIKTRMREAIAGQKLEAMNAPLQMRLSASKAAQFLSAPVATQQPVTSKEEVHVPVRR